MKRDIDSRLIDYAERYEGEGQAKAEEPPHRARFRPIQVQGYQQDQVLDSETGEIMCLAVVCAMLQFETELRELAEARAAKPRPRTTRTIVDLRQRRRRAA